MDAREVLYTTRSIRRVKPDPIPDDVVARIIDAGVRAPTGGNAQEWRFVGVTEAATITRLGEVFHRCFTTIVLPRYEGREVAPDAASAGAGMTRRVLDAAIWQAGHFGEVPLVVCAYATAMGSGPSIYPAMWQMCLAARAEGVGSTFTTLLAMAAASEVDDILGVPEGSGFQLAGVLPMGYPRGHFGVAPRRPAHEVAFSDRWGQSPSWSAPAPLWP